MAWIEVDTRTGFFKIGFRIGDRRIKRSLQVNDRTEAEATCGVVEQTLIAIERGWTQIPADIDAGDFVLSGGRLQQKVVVPKRVTLAALFDAYFNSLPANSLEASTITGMNVHRRHLEKHFKKSYSIQQLTVSALQEYIQKRTKDKGLHGRNVTATTIEKAIVTLRTVWNWGRHHGLLDYTIHFPSKGLQYPKATEKPPFLTFAEVRRRAHKAAEAAGLWECVFLSLPEINELLELVKERARHAFIYPMFVLAAHAGPRRSEMIRSKLHDLDFEVNMVTVHERKKSHEKRTTRRVPMSNRLREALLSWIDTHPGGEYTFCQAIDMPRSRRRSSEIVPLTRDEAHHHFKRTLAGTKWEKLRGWHVFRHSFCSNCAAKGIDQRIIDDWVGHLSEEMVRRYRHLLPDQQRVAIGRVFG